MDTTATPLCCTPKSLGNDMIVEASDNARAENPANGTPVEKLLRFLPDLELTPQRIGVLTTKYLGPAGARNLPVYFFEGSRTLQTKILKYANKWGKSAGIKFSRTTSAANAFIRVALQPGQGYWSYLGTDCRLIPRQRQTMNLDSFTVDTSDSEFDRVVCHEFGHALGFPHEHLRAAEIRRMDPEKVIAHFMATQGWSRQEVIAQVLIPIDERSLLYPTAADDMSIMCYHIEGSLCYDGQPIIGGDKINNLDAAYAGKIYPTR